MKAPQDYPAPENFTQEQHQQLLQEFKADKKKKDKEPFCTAYSIPVTNKEFTTWQSQNKKYPLNILALYLSYLATNQTVYSSFLMISTGDLYSSKTPEKQVSAVKVSEFATKIPYSLINMNPNVLDIITIVIYMDGKRYLGAFVNIKTQRGVIIDLFQQEKNRQKCQQIGQFIEKLLQTNYQLTVQNINWTVYLNELDKSTDQGEALMVVLAFFLFMDRSSLPQDEMIDVSTINLTQDEIKENRQMFEWIMLKFRQDPHTEFHSQIIKNQDQHFQQRIDELHRQQAEQEEIKRQEEEFMKQQEQVQKQKEQQKLKTNPKLKNPQGMTKLEDEERDFYENLQNHQKYKYLQSKKQDDDSKHVPRDWRLHSPMQMMPENDNPESGIFLYFFQLFSIDSTKLKLLSQQFNKNLRNMVQQQNQIVTMAREQQNMKIRLLENERKVELLQYQLQQQRDEV